MRLNAGAMLAVWVCGLLAASGAAQTPAGVLTPAEVKAWTEDLQYMTTEMARQHKNLFHTLSRDAFARQADSIKARLPSMTRAEAIVALAQLTASVGDGHTNIYPTRDPAIGFHTLPVTFTWFGPELRIRAVHESQSGLLGARVVRIGSLDVDAAQAAVRTMVGHDNEQGVRYWSQYLLAMPEVLHALGMAASADEVSLTIEQEQGVRTVQLRPFAPVEMMSGDIATLFNRRPGWIDARDRPGPGDPTWLAHTRDVLRFEHLGELLYVQMNQITDAPDETLEHFAGRLRDEIAATRPAKVAIDLRLNRGGDGTLIVPVIRSLIQSTGIDQKGRLFAIIGNATFSAAQMFVDELEQYTNVTFVGEPTGSRGNVYGDSRRITLPHSGLTVRVSVYYWQYWHPTDTRTATTPAISAPLTFADYVANADPSLTAILNHVPDRK